jgi:hypothetical protein
MFPPVGTCALAIIPRPRTATMTAKNCLIIVLLKAVY